MSPGNTSSEIDSWFCLDFVGLSKGRDKLQVH